jgi:hypothetical protein
MNGLELLYFILGGTFGAVCACVYLLKKILNILTMWNHGEPSKEDMRDMELSKIKMKR